MTESSGFAALLHFSIRSSSTFTMFLKSDSGSVAAASRFHCLPGSTTNASISACTAGERLSRSFLLPPLPPPPSDRSQIPTELGKSLLKSSLFPGRRCAVPLIFRGGTQAAASQGITSAEQLRASAAAPLGRPLRPLGRRISAAHGGCRRAAGKDMLLSGTGHRGFCLAALHRAPPHAQHLHSLRL